MQKWIWAIVLSSLALVLTSCRDPNLSAVDIQRMDPSEAKVLLDDGEAALYDVRSAQSYQGKHAAGAISLPETQLGERLSDLPDDKMLIFY